MRYPAAPLQAVVFDLDGLMFNTEQVYAQIGHELLRRRGKTFTSELRDRMMGRPSREALRIMIDEHQLEATVADLEAESDALFPALLAENLKPLPGLLDLLAALEAAAIPKAVATSSRRNFVETVLNQFDLTPRLRFVLTAENVREGKPHPEIYLTAAEKMGAPPERMMVLEDSGNGCRAAVAAGAYTVAIPGEHSRAHAFDGAAFIASSLADERIYTALDLAPPTS